ncbi:ATP synthase F1 subunit epsilon [Parvularcula dongshanensis]|uniref:ATP synthase epsilon chain n=1 Tax=Parvularcula dongshanensis TaxID=1173995 RepID=A0A840I0M1_9PROT|nr:ATP synthase F1 subunit epsilon [Parvularcula dongshanensis]MBB4657752.1 F-type H+-transporting ATPase subunit epsilon [Parvularcula dongshanensis]
MAKLPFSLVTPEREYASGEADSVLVPGTEGLFEVQANHAPLMSTLSPGILVIRNAGTERRLFVRGGFADVNPEGLTVLAEVAIPEDELKGDVLGRQKQAAQKALSEGGTPEQVLEQQRAVDVLAGY